MLPCGVRKAKASFFTLLARVVRGEEVVITRHGKAVARLVPATPAKDRNPDTIIADIKRLRVGNRLGNLRWQDLRDAGRR